MLKKAMGWEPCYRTALMAIAEAFMVRSKSFEKSGRETTGRDDIVDLRDAKACWGGWVQVSVGCLSKSVNRPTVDA